MGVSVDGYHRKCWWSFARGSHCAGMCLKLKVPACTTFACLQVRSSLSVLQVGDVSLPIALGLWLMMLPVLTKVQYEKLGAFVKDRAIAKQMGVSFVLNWVVGPALMTGLAWACLPDLPGFRNGVILVGLARWVRHVETLKIENTAAASVWTTQTGFCWKSVQAVVLGFICCPNATRCCVCDVSCGLQVHCHGADLERAGRR